MPALNPDAYEHLRFTQSGRRLTISIDRPGRLNAVNARLHTELARVFVDAAADPASDVIVLTGAGRAFCAGGDVEWMQDAIDEPRSFIDTIREARQIVYGLIDCEKPVIARVNGPAVGLGATLALFCDLIVMANDAYFADPHVNIGMTAGDGGAVIWPQLVGYARAKQYLFTGERIGACDAERLGLANVVAPAAELDAAIDALVDRLLKQPQQALRATKLSVNVGLRQVAAGVLEASLAHETVSNLTRQHREAVAAFRENRAARLDGSWFDNPHDRR
jgi:enoyl-CoA hydratase